MKAPNLNSQKPEARSQKPEARSQKPEARSQKPEARSQKPEARNQKQETRNQKTENRNSMTEIKKKKTKILSAGALPRVQPQWRPNHQKKHQHKKITRTMSDYTKIQSCHQHRKPDHGLPRLRAFPLPAGGPRGHRDRPRECRRTSRGAEPELLFRLLIAQHRTRVAFPSRHHKRAVTTTNIWHLRKVFEREIRKRHGRAASAAATHAIEQAVTCYAAKLHLNRGYSLLPKRDGSPRKLKKGYAPTFEEVTTFAGRVWEAAGWSDLLDETDSRKDWISVEIPRLIFVSDMGDAFSRRSDFPFLRREVIEPISSDDGLRHLCLWLTKRPERMAEFATSIGGFPANVCAMTTVTGPDTLHRVRELQRVKASVRGLSIEPLWKRIHPRSLPLRGIDWIILGGESGAGRVARPFPLEYAEELRDYCAERGVAFFLKQLGRNPTRGGQTLKPLLKDKHGGDWEEWPSGLKVRQFPEYFRQYRAAESAKNCM